MTSPKPLEEVLAHLEAGARVALVGCGSCATVAGTGGEPEVRAMREELARRGYAVVFSTVLDTACHRRLAERAVRDSADAIASASAIIALTCGSGAQNLAEAMGKLVIPALNTDFIGRTERAGSFTEFCRACGDCVLAETGGVCPKTRCPKGMLNGPCGGMFGGRCEVHEDEPCAWALIRERLGSVEAGIFARIVGPAGHPENARPRRRS